MPTAIMTSPAPPIVSSIITPVPSSASSVASGSGSGSESDVSLLMTNSVFNANAMYMNSAYAAPTSTGLVNPNTPHHPIAEFLYQLTKMLTDNNTELIEWADGRIHVHDPQRLADEVLHKYFRHSKYASFQRQLNYFGFRKIAGKGKMSPCSYVNDAASDDIRSLLFIKRKTNGSASKKAAAAVAKAAAAAAASEKTPSGGVKRKAKDSVSAMNERPMPDASLATVPQSSSLLAHPGQNAAFLQAMMKSVAPKSVGESLHFPNEKALPNFASCTGAGQQQLDDKFLSSMSNQQQAFLNSMTMPNSMPCPATAAMNAAAAAANQSNNLFESSTNLSSFLSNDPTGGASRGPVSAGSSKLASSSLLSSLPSSNTIFPDSLSNISLNRMMQAQSRSGTSRIPSLLGLNNMLSRESSLVDLAMLPSMPSAQQLQSLGIYMEPTPIQEMNGPMGIMRGNKF